MVYLMEFKVTGICRDEGEPGAVAAATATLEYVFPRLGHVWVSEPLPLVPTPTKERADIEAIIMALEWSLETYDGLMVQSGLDLRVLSDSQYAVDCMNVWTYDWEVNGWIDAAGHEVANCDLLMTAVELENKVRDRGTVTYTWVPTEEMEHAIMRSHERLAEVGY